MSLDTGLYSRKSMRAGKMSVFVPLCSGPRKKSGLYLSKGSLSVRGEAERRQSRYDCIIQE